MKNKILFYDDDEHNRGNKIFFNRLQEEIPEATSSWARSIDTFESKIRHFIPNIFILDLMGPESHVKRFDRDEYVKSYDVGIELLRRIRNDKYENQLKDSIIIIRTARTDSDARSECQAEGSNHFFSLAEKNVDERILQLIKKLVHEM